MSTPSNAIHDSSVLHELPATASIPLSRRIYWALRRELWESRSIWLAPLAVAVVAVFGFLIGAVQLPAKVRAVAGSHSALPMHGVIERPFDMVAGLLMLTTVIVAVVYSLDALYGERRDRSILFWKSMPVSDLTTVLVKASVPIVILPLLTFVLTIAVQLFMAVTSSAILAAAGLSVADFWQHLSFVRMSVLLLYHLVAVHAIGWAPVFAWLLLVSAWARRAPYLWAILPPLAIAMVEHMAFGTSYFRGILGRTVSGMETVATTGQAAMPMNPMTTSMTPGAYLASPGFWIGLVLTVLFLAAAARLRRSQSPT